MTSHTIYEKTYWNHKGKHGELLDALRTLVPDSGEVCNADNHPALERFRVASNCYYDLYNNGLCNLADEFSQIFGFTVPNGELTPEIVKDTEREMNRIIVAAAKEQKVEVPNAH
jgi:hypothetical protein